MKGTKDGILYFFFMFGILLGYDLCDRCERYRKRKNESGKCSHCKKCEMQIV